VLTFRRIETPLGVVTAVADDDWLTALHLPGDAFALPGDAVEGGPTVDRAAVQLAEWFAGEREHFDLPLAPAGTTFQRRVWAALVAVPYGETATYGDIAAAIGQPTATRAVGAANGRNPIPLIIPCHRVIGSDGSLTGYSGGGGIETKRHLLDLERGVLALEV
jgi:methylated-DNA-[protein]-cysteine S-methyltransferase